MSCQNGIAWGYHAGRSGHPNDPDNGEYELGICPECEGRGCENDVDEQELLISLAQLLDGKRQEGLFVVRMGSGASRQDHKSA